MIISNNGDSLITQAYELVIKSKKIYFITPFASYLHIKGEKYRTRIRFDEIKRKKIFKLVDSLTWKNIDQYTTLLNRDRYFIINTFKSDKILTNYQISEESLPSDFKTLYEVLSDRK